MIEREKIQMELVKLKGGQRLPRLIETALARAELTPV